MEDERRLHPRLEIPLTVDFRLQGSEAWQRGTIKNLSAGGAALYTDSEVPVGSLLANFRFTLPEEPASGEPIDVAALVLRSGPDETETAKGQYLSGLHFLDLEGAAFERVRLFVFRQLAGS